MKNNVGFLLREGFRGFRKHGFMSFAAICVTVACMIIIGSFALIAYNINRMVSDLESSSQILVFVDENYTLAQAESIGTQLSQIENITSREFVSREQALENYTKIHDDPTAFDGISANTFRNRFIVTLEDNTKLSQTKQQMLAIEGVDEVKSPDDIINGFVVIQHILNLASIAIILVLLIVSLFVISNTVKLAMYDRKDEIAIMKMVGATNGFIRLPFVVEGTILGLLSAGISFALEWGLYDLVSYYIERADTLHLFEAAPFSGMIRIITAGAFLVVGLLVGVFGSLMSIRKFLDV